MVGTSPPQDRATDVPPRPPTQAERDQLDHEENRKVAWAKDIAMMALYLALGAIIVTMLIRVITR